MAKVWLGKQYDQLLSTSFPTEVEASKMFEEIMSPYFHLLPEVNLRHHDGSPMRIDWVGIPRSKEELSWLDIAGFEIKRDLRPIGKLTAALEQGRDYRDAKIIDHRCKNFRGKRLPFVFIFPDPTIEFESRFLMHEGAVRLAGKNNVGMLKHEFHHGHPRVMLKCSAGRLWGSDIGSSKPALVIKTDKKRGSR